MEEDEVVMVTGSLYGAEPEEVGKALVENLRGGDYEGEILRPGQLADICEKYKYLNHSYHLR